MIGALLAVVVGLAASAVLGLALIALVPFRWLVRATALYALAAPPVIGYAFLGWIGLAAGLLLDVALVAAFFVLVVGLTSAVIASIVEDAVDDG